MAEVHGLRLRLRLIQPSDAAYVHALRTDPRYNAFLSPVTGTVADQRSWIEHYKQREAQGAEYYYVVEQREDDAACGLIRLYDIEEDRFIWGSWILAENRPPKAALESALLSFSLGFHRLGASLALIDVRKGNARAIAFYRRFGMTEVGDDAQNFHFEYRSERFEQDKAGYMAFLREGAAA